MKITSMKLNGVTNPVGFTYEKLLFSWKVTDTSAKTQKNARIELSNTEDFSNVLASLSGDLTSNETELVVELNPYTSYYWKVTVEAENGEVGEGIASFETGKMDEAWEGKWIACELEDTYHPVFKKDISVSKPLKRARLYICGLGLFEAYVNDQKIGNEYLAPFINDYEEAFQVITYDLTNQLKENNTLSVMLGDGWYKSVFGLDLMPNRFGDRLCMIAELRMEYEDESVEVIPTDDSWKYQGSDVEASGIYLGETFNRMLYKNKENPWKNAVVIDAPKHGKLVDRYSLPVIIKETLSVAEVIHTPAGETVLDFGQNHTGFMSFTADFPEGTTITFETAEILQEGNFYHDNYRDAESKFIYVSDGRKEEVRPHFTFFGYRYLKVTGWPGEIAKDAVTANVVYSDLERIGYIETSNEKINRLYQNCVWGQKSNFLDIPTDCPQRSERLGWTGDAQVFTPTASYNMDTRAFYYKFFKDLRSDQLRFGGAVSKTIPSFGELSMLGAAVWADVATMSPDALYHIYGNAKQLELSYPLMKDWVEWMRRKDDEEEGGARKCISRATFGDWLALDGLTEQSMKGGTEDDVLNHAYYYWSTKVTGDMAAVLGYEEDAKDYAKLAAEIKEAFLQEYFTPNGRYAQDTQAAYIVALKFGLYRDKERLLEQFKRRLQYDCYEIRCGFVGAPLLCLTLCENGMEDLAYEFLFKEEFPSWLYCVNLGATTIWERWNSLLPDGTCSGTGMNSFNHYSYGSVVEFMYKYIAGIRSAEPGFRKAVIAPIPRMHFKKFHCSYDSACGKYVSNWDIKEDGTFVMEVEIPFNCTAEVTLPRYNGQDIIGADGISIDEAGMMVLDAGHYTFTYFPSKDFREVYGPQTRLIHLADDEEAIGIIAKTLPQMAGMIQGSRYDKECANWNLGELVYMFFMGFSPEKNIPVNEQLFQLKRYDYK